MRHIKKMTLLSTFFCFNHLVLIPSYAKEMLTPLHLKLHARQKMAWLAAFYDNRMT